MKYLIDSDILIDFFNNRTDAVNLIRNFNKSELSISVITLAEILEGLVETKKFEIVKKGLTQLEIFPVDTIVAENFANQRAKLRKAGNLIDNMDIFIASTALVHDLILLTGNKRDFGRIASLKLYGN